jgi:hypothetical protein
MIEAFVYCLTDHAKNMVYVGWHKGSTDDGYLCSSKIVLEEYSKRPTDFTRQIIASGSVDDMVSLEVSILKATNAKYDPSFYNMHNGMGKYVLKAHTKEAKEKISKSNIGRKRPDLSERNKSKENPAKLGLCGRSMKGELNPMYGRKHTAESKALMSKNKIGKNTSPKSEETKRKMALARKLWWEKKRNGNE